MVCPEEHADDRARAYFGGAFCFADCGGLPGFTTSAQQPPRPVTPPPVPAAAGRYFHDKEFLSRPTIDKSALHALRTLGR